MYQAPTENSLLEKTGDMRAFMNWYCQKMGKIELTQADLEDHIDWANREGDQVRIDISKHLPLNGPPVRNSTLTDTPLNQATTWSDVTCRASHQEYTIAEKDFKNLYPNDFEDLNLLLLQGHLNHLLGLDIRMLFTLNLTKPGWDATCFEFKHDYTIIDLPPAVMFPVSNNERKIMRFNEIYKFSDGTLTNIIEALDYRVKEYKILLVEFIKKDCVLNNRLEVSRLQHFKISRFVNSPPIFVTPPNRVLSNLVSEGMTSLNISSTKHKERPLRRIGKLGDSDVHTLEDPTLIHETLSRRLFLRLNLPDHRLVLTGSGGSIKETSRTTNSQAFTIKKGMSMPVQMSPAQDDKRPKVDDQRLDLADDLKEAQDHISSIITSHKTKITTSMYKISHKESKTMS
ncbi:hypothetical protein Tco_0138513 [Tanacetum coccineum]